MTETGTLGGVCKVTSQAKDKKPARASSESCQGAKDEKESVQESRDTEKIIK